MESSELPRPTMTGQDIHKPGCFGCGHENPHGIQGDFRFHEETGEVRFTYQTRRHHEGAPGYVHGGILASLLDEAQGMLCFHVGHSVMTDQLHMKYHLATPLGESIQIRCWLTAVRRRRIYTHATIHNSKGVLLVSSRAIWYALPERLMRRMFQDQFPPEEEERIRGLLEANRRRAREIRHRLRREKRETKVDPENIREDIT